MSYTAPPVNEVYLAVQFESPVADERTALAEFWPRVLEQFPGLERQPALPRIGEQFDTPPTPPPFPFEIGTAAPPQRYWFVSGDSNRLLQVQPDRFLFNWRKVRPEDDYPRYSTLRPEFEQSFATFLDSLPPEKRDGATADWCEIGYINHVEARGDTAFSHLPLSRVLRFVDQPPSDALAPAEDMQVQFRKVIRDQDRPTGRLYFTAAAGFRAHDQVPIYVIQLFMRGRPEGNDMNDIVNFFDRGRELIVSGFTEATTQEMHDAWGLQARG